MRAYYMRTYRMEASMSEEEVWRGEYAIETSASPAIIWSIFRDVPGWKI